MGMPLYFLRRHAFLFVPFFYIGRKIHAFFHVGRGCLGAQPRHTVGAVYHGAGDSCSFLTLGVFA